MRNNQRASALISALFIMTLVAIAATAMAVRLRMDIYRTTTLLSSDTLYLASQAVTGWAMDELSVQNTSFVALNGTGKIRQLPKQLEHMFDFSQATAT